MADDDEPQDEAPAAKPAPFGGKAAPLFKGKGKAKKFLDDHRLAVLSVLLGVVGLWFVFRNRSSSTAGSTSSNVSGQSAPASSNPDDILTSSDPSSMQPWWTGTAGGGGGSVPITGTPATGSSSPPAKHASAPAAKGAAKPQPSSHPASSPAKSSRAASVAAPRTNNRAGTLAGLYAPISPSSSALHSVAATAHPASHVAVGTSHLTDSSVLVPFTYRTGTPAPSSHLPAPHAAASAKRPAGRRVAGHSGGHAA